MTRRRVCLLLPAHWSGGMGGAEYQAKLLIEHWLAGYDVEIVYLTARADPAYEPAGYSLVRFSTDTGIRRYGSFFDAFRLYRALCKTQPDVIYQQVGCAHTGIAAFYARRHGRRMIWRVANDRTLVPQEISFWRHPHRWLERRFMEYGIRHADAVYVQNSRQQRLLADRYGRDSVLIKNFHPSVGGPGKRGAGKRVVWIANLKATKDPHAFLRLARSFAGRADAEFVMIGAKIDDTRWTKELLDAISATSNVRWLGALSQDEVNSHLEDACMLVNTSDYEGFANTFIQAWLRAVPVVSLHADPDELLSKHGLGFVSGAETVLREHVERLLDAPELVAQMGKACREYARAAHSMANADRVAELLGLERLEGLQPVAGYWSTATHGDDRVRGSAMPLGSTLRARVR
jgi:glycosyltransferase involved in cell wall biosynthesis